MKLSVLFLIAALVAVASAHPAFVIRQEEELEPSPLPSDESTESDLVCVDEAYLVSLGHSRHDMVHKQSTVTSALCPGGALPCGTEHHMVRVAGLPMSYRQLCETRACQTKLVAVNSVFTHVWQEREHDGVVMTMFDHRYPEMAQKALHWTIKNARRVVAI